MTSRNALFSAVAFVSLAGALAIGWPLYAFWAGELSLLPDAWDFARDWDEVTASVRLGAAAGCLAFAGWLASFMARGDKRPVLGLCLAGMAFGSPAGMALAGMFGGGMLVLAVPIALGAMAAGAVAVLLLEGLLGQLARGLAAAANAAKARRLAGRLYGLARLFLPGAPGLCKREAFAWYEGGSFARARPLFERLYEQGETDRQMLEILEVCYREEGDWNRAADCLEKLIKEKTADRAMLERLAEACENAGRLDRALQAREAALNPNAINENEAVAQLAIRLGLWERALPCARRVRDAERRPFPRAVNLYEAIARSSDAPVEALEDLADLRARLGSEIKAAELWERILKIDPERREARLKLADFWRRTGALESEEAQLRALLQGSPDADTMGRLAENLDEQKRPADAKKLLVKAIRQFPGVFRFPYTLSQLCFAQGDLEGAISGLKYAEAAAADQDYVRLNALKRKIESERSRLALETLRARVEENPDDVAARFALFEHLISIGESASARLELDKQLQRNPESRAEVMARLDELIEATDQNYLLMDYKADLLFKDKALDEALALFERMAAKSLHGARALRAGCERILRADPMHEGALERLAELARANGEHALTVELHERLNEKRGECRLESARALFDAHRALNQPKRAEAYGRQLLDAAPGDAELRLQVAELLEAAEQYQAALDLLDAAPEEIGRHPSIESARRRLDRRRKNQIIGTLIGALAKKPDDCRAHYELALLYDETFQLDLAITHFQRASRSDDFKNRATARLGYCLAKREMYDLAEETLKSVQLKLDGSNDAELEELKELIYSSAILFEKNEMGKRALEFYKMIFRVDAAYKDVVDRIGRQGG